MKSLRMEYKYTNGLVSEGFLIKGKPAPSSCAIAWCMIATGFNRIFTREDVREFLFRITLSLDRSCIIENWFNEDELIGFEGGNEHHSFGLEDIMKHFGFQIFDEPENCTKRSQYLANIADSINNAICCGAFGSFSVIGPERRGFREYARFSKKYAPEVTKGLILKAEAFADYLMSLIPEDIFQNKNKRIYIKEKELSERRERVKALPVFDITKIRDEVIRECLMIMYDHRENFVDTILSDPEDYDNLVRPMIYLAWLWANGFIISDGRMVQETEGFELDYDDYVDDDGNIDLIDTVERFHIEETVPLLKGILI